MGAAGNVPKRDLLVMNVPEAKDYQLVYDLDLGKISENINYALNAGRFEQPH